MTDKKHAELAIAFLEEFCTDIDRRRTMNSERVALWRRALRTSAVLGAAMAPLACGGETEPPANSPAEVCGDAKDNDGDGKIDCADSDCYGNQLCVGTDYGVPYDAGDASETQAPAENCTDKVDNDGDGRIDCADLDCKYQYPVCMGPEYAAPF